MWFQPTDERRCRSRSGFLPVLSHCWSTQRSSDIWGREDFCSCIMDEHQTRSKIDAHKNFPLLREPLCSRAADSSLLMAPWNQGMLSCAVVAMSFSSCGRWLMMACSRAAPCTQNTQHLSHAEMGPSHEAAEGLVHDSTLDDVEPIQVKVGKTGFSEMWAADITTVCNWQLFLLTHQAASKAGDQPPHKCVKISVWKLPVAPFTTKADEKTTICLVGCRDLRSNRWASASPVILLTCHH